MTEMQRADKIKLQQAINTLKKYCGDHACDEHCLFCDLGECLLQREMPYSWYDVDVEDDI